MENVTLQAEQEKQLAQMFKAEQNVAKAVGRELSPEEKALVWLAYSFGRVDALPAVAAVDVETE